MDPVTVRVSSKGRIVIPVSIRRRLGLSAGSSVEVRLGGDGTLLLRVRREIRETTIDDGYGMIRYSGPPRSLADFDVARAIRGDYAP
jgi:AbrB family looped-hinge helix DNA binding protein